MEKKYQVFVSSTYADLKEERLAATQCLLDNDCIPVGMEQFPASGMKQMDYIKKLLDNCDYYILILAGRYGSLDSDGKGFTEKEFDYALDKKIPVMCFVFELIEQLPCSKIERTDAGRDRFSKFREKVCNGRIVSFYNNVDELKSRIATSINKCIKDFPAVGWVRGDKLTKDDSTEKKFNDYLKKQEMSIDAINTLFDTTEDAKSSRNIYTKATSEQYKNTAESGTFTFDYSNNNGEFVIGSGEKTFVTTWSKASNTSIHAYKYGIGIKEIGRVKAPIELQDALNVQCDFSSRTRSPQIGDVIIWKNQFGNYAATKILYIKDDTRGDDHDELSCEYIIYDSGTKVSES